jgi:hypothetical protein
LRTVCGGADRYAAGDELRDGRVVSLVVSCGSPAGPRTEFKGAQTRVSVPQKTLDDFSLSGATKLTVFLP